MVDKRLAETYNECRAVPPGVTGARTQMKTSGDKQMTVKDLKPGKSAEITSVGGEGALRQHFLDMGVIPGAKITVTQLAPMGDPMEIRIHGYELTLRLSDAEKIGIRPVEGPAGKEEKKKEEKSRQREADHPGLGEEGKFHPRGSGTPLPDGTVLTFARVPAPDNVARCLRIQAGTQVVNLKRVRFVDNNPMALEDSFIRLQETESEKIFEHDFRQESLYHFLSDV